MVLSAYDELTPEVLIIWQLRSAKITPRCPQGSLLPGRLGSLPWFENIAAASLQCVLTNVRSIAVQNGWCRRVGHACKATWCRSVDLGSRTPVRSCSLGINPGNSRSTDSLLARSVWASGRSLRRMLGSNGAQLWCNTPSQANFCYWARWARTDHCLHEPRGRPC